MIIDSHCHLNYPEFSDLSATLDNASASGVELMQTISCKRSDFKEVIDLTEKSDRIYGSIGIHPHEAEAHQDVTVEELVKWSQHPRIIGIGESGLDYYYDNSPRDLQRNGFSVHIEAARETGLPLIVHTRDADDDMIEMIQSAYNKGAYKGLLHCFSSTQRMADAALEIGFYISLSGIITFKKADELREVVKTIPMDRLLVETDSPYLAPIPHRGKPNEPAYTRHVLEKLAEIKEVSIEEMARVTTDNFFRLFSKANRP